MIFRHYLLAVRSRILAVVCIVGITMATALAMRWSMPDVYRAAATVLIDAGPIDPATQRYNPMIERERFQMQHMINQLNLLDSTQVARHVAVAIHATESPEVHAAWEEETGGVGDIATWYGNLIRPGLYVEVPDNMAVVKVGFQSFDPEGASQLANEFVKALVAVNADMRTQQEQRRLELLTKRIARLRGQLRQAWREFLKAQAANPMTDAVDPRREAGTRLRSLSRAQLSAQTGDISYQARSREVARDVANAPDLTAMYPVAQDMLSDITAEEVSLSDLRARLGESHPDYIAARSRLTDMTARLARELQRVKQQELDESAIASESSRSITAAFGQERTSALSAMKEAARVYSLAQRVDVLDRDYMLAYLTYQNTLNLQAFSFPRVSVVNWALAPNKPSGVPKVVTLVVGLVVGLFLALSYVFFADKLDHRVYSREDLRALLPGAVFTLPRRVHG